MDSDAIQSFLASDTSSITAHIPQSSYSRPVCCCGNAACVFLKQNESALESLERDVRTAARVGQALLMRHETYIADSEKERQAMTVHIEQLETEKQMLERKNATVIEENRSLLDQLEGLNNAVTESDVHVTSLQATLQSTQQELQRLAQLAARTERLEQQLQDYEREQQEWHASFAAKEESEKSAVRRWQQAERTLGDLQAQIERIEREAREDRERHVEVVGRMERRHAVENELNSAAGRLKGAAAAKTTGREGGGTTVVSHFVKDILQDNANLQMGIVELRDMLQNSNDEVETLRKQLLDHQPAEEPPSQTAVKQKDLRAELNRASSQELHVHHHYHAPTPSASKTPTVRRPKKKKRYGVLTPGHFTPPSGFSTPRSSISYGTPTSAATILQQTAVSIPQSIPGNKRFSAQSHQTYHSMLSSSGPSSPQSTTNRTSSLFDRVFSDAGHESSRPTTPDTEDPGSPLFLPARPKRGSGSSFRTNSAPIVSRRGISPSAGRPSFDSVLGTSLDQALLANEHSGGHDAIPEEEEAEWENESSPLGEEGSSVTSPLSDDLMDPIRANGAFYRQPLRRAASHESLMSVSGMDIHALKARPSQLLTGNGGRSFTAQTALSDAHAQPSATLSRPSDSGRSLLSGMAADQRQAGRQQKSLSTKASGWFFGRWGATPTPTRSSPSTATSVAAGTVSSSKPPSRSSASEQPAFDPQATPKKPKHRPPGINQSGPIVGFAPEVKTLHAPIVRSLDEEGLRRALGN